MNIIDMKNYVFPKQPNLPERVSFILAKNMKDVSVTSPIKPAILYECIFENCYFDYDLINQIFINCRFVNCHFRKIKIHNTVFLNCNSSELDFTLCDVKFNRILGTEFLPLDLLVDGLTGFEIP